MRIAAVIVAHGNAPYLSQTLESITAQSRTPDALIAICDATTTAVNEDLKLHGFDIHPATSTATNVTTRIAQNFAQGVKQASQCDLVVLGDHDDIWHRERVAHHESVARHNPDSWMFASDARLIDHANEPLGSTLHGTFPVPRTWNEQNARQQWAYALRHSVATGGASALRPAQALQVQIPPGWLHDRWWSLAATRAGALVIDNAIVIDYRITDLQQVGLNTHGQESRGTWFSQRLRSLPSTLRKSIDLASLMWHSR